MTATKEVYQGYVGELDVTVVFESVTQNKKDVSKEIKGFYNGHPTEEKMKSFLSSEQNAFSETYDKKELTQSFSDELDMTIIFEHWKNGNEVVKTEVKGFYYGEADEEGLKEYYGKTKINY